MIMTLKHLLFLLIIFTPSTIIATKKLQTYIIHVRLPGNGIFENSNEELERWYESFLPISKRNTSIIIHMYRHVMSGFSAKVTPRELDEISKMEGFVYARAAKKYKLLTTRTPNFLGLHRDAGPWRSPANFGKGVIIGVVDTGITPGHPSFDDHGMPPPPPKWKGRCEFKTKMACNNKLIGARSFMDKQPPLDEEGHGTFTASTAAGNFVPGANVFGQANGTASGLAPLAHLAIYRMGDDDSTILAAIDAAIEDGVDVLSMSISINRSSLPFYEDSIAIGSFAAMSRGIFVSCAAGNEGPRMYSLVNEAPWILTVGGSTSDREIRGIVKLGNNEVIEGETIGNVKFPSVSLPLVNGADREIDVDGKIVFTIDSAMGYTSGPAAHIEANDNVSAYTIELFPDVEVPTIEVSNFAGEKIKAYINSTPNPVATISFVGTVLGVKTAPTVGSLSSRGPNLASPGILKPDIIGPGVNIVGAWHESMGDNIVSKAAAFNLKTGTSFSCPHLSGVAALVKSSHPDWSPAMIKSAIMTTATQVNLNKDPILDERHLPADIFAVGAGHVNPSSAMDPGLVYDIPSRDYISYLCSLYDEQKVEVIVREKVNCKGSEHQGITREAELNYPSLAVHLVGMSSNVTYSRTLTNVGRPKSRYHVEIEGFQSGIEIKVEPQVLVFTEVNQKMTYKVNLIRMMDFMSPNGSDYSYDQGSISWVSTKYRVRIPVSVKYD
ncbi:hypothetical protein CASFOL_012964 [Castilleja foliolosa]|uniref:Uncharacterized protein n=1 Tax=Castilleja foliolosa TaxID=1961234 RepID=A0ABD3DJW1_9LAMI